MIFTSDHLITIVWNLTGTPNFHWRQFLNFIEDDPNSTPTQPQLNPNLTPIHL